jgi:hypothetical protein
MNCCPLVVDPCSYCSAPAPAAAAPTPAAAAPTPAAAQESLPFSSLQEEDTCGAFAWSDPPIANGKTARGTINEIGYTYTSSWTVSTSPDIFNHSVFPGSFGVPNQTSIRNDVATRNTLSFDEPVANLVLVLASMGHTGMKMSIQFSSDCTVLFSKDVVQNTPSKITGEEGYAIVRFRGNLTSLSFNLSAEAYCNVTFGACLT